MLGSRDEFEIWLIQMDDRLEELADLLPKNVARELDFSVGSLDALEGWLLKNYANYKSLFQESEARLFDCLASYVGETFRKCVGGKWNIDLDDPDDVFYQLPVIENRNEWSEAPATLITASLDRRTGNYMSEVVLAFMEDAR